MVLILLAPFIMITAASVLVCVFGHDVVALSGKAGVLRQDVGGILPGIFD